MDDTQAFSDVVAAIYDAGLDPTSWPSALQQSSRFINVHSSSIISIDMTDGGRIHFEDGTIDPHYSRLYFETYAKLDPFVVPRFFKGIGEPVANTDVMPIEEIKRSRIYRDWAQPQGLLDCICVTLERKVTCAAMFSVLLHERDGVADPERKRRVELLVPHVRRALLISNAVDLGAAKVATFAAALDGLRSAVVFVDAEGMVRHANSVARAMLTDGDVIRAAGGRLATRDADVDVGLREVFARTTAGDVLVGDRGIAIPLTSARGERFVANVLPLSAGGRHRAGGEFAATAAVFVQEAAVDLVAPPIVLARAFALTLAETRVATAIVDVGGIAAVADALGLAEATVKVHLKNIYAKTGVARQADLVKLVASFSSPLRH